MTRRTGPWVIRRETLSIGVRTEWEHALAYHEAGHAAMYFFFGELGDICYIDMVPSRDSDACVFARNGSMSLLRSDASISMGLKRLYATKVIMQKLAGLCAENRVTCRNKKWFRCPVLRRDLKAGKQFDFPQAMEAAKMVYANSDQADQFAELIATWTEDALTIPRLWAVVEALAEQLKSVERLEGDDAREVMVTAWGDGDLPPYMHVGSEWRRRLSVPEEGMDL